MHFSSTVRLVRDKWLKVSHDAGSALIHDVSYGGFSGIAQLEVVQYIDGVILTSIYDVQ